MRNQFLVIINNVILSPWRLVESVCCYENGSANLAMRILNPRTK